MKKPDWTLWIKHSGVIFHSLSHTSCNYYFEIDFAVETRRSYVFCGLGSACPRSEKLVKIWRTLSKAKQTKDIIRHSIHRRFEDKEDTSNGMKRTWLLRLIWRGILNIVQEARKELKRKKLNWWKKGIFSCEDRWGCTFIRSDHWFASRNMTKQNWKAFERSWWEKIIFINEIGMKLMFCLKKH